MSLPMKYETQDQRLVSESQSDDAYGTERSSKVAALQQNFERWIKLMKIGFVVFVILYIVLVGVVAYIAVKLHSKGETEATQTFTATANSMAEKGTKGDAMGKKTSPDSVGQKGDPGLPGLKGEQGLPGLKGEPGLPGSKGDPGHSFSELKGARGLPGLKGEPGLPGLKGVPGLPGRPGLDGLTGMKGEPGWKGEVGLPGLKGEPGLPGLQGSHGLPGIKGETGRRGLKGEPGLPGLIESGPSGIKEAGSVYIRFGKQTCPGNGTELIYSGIVGGSELRHAAAAVNYLCLPTDPMWGYYNDLAGAGASLYGGEYQFGSAEKCTEFFGRDIYDRDAVCAVCLSSRSNHVMIPGRNKCYPGWTEEYSGYLTAGNTADKAPSEYVCLDRDPEYRAGSKVNKNGKVFYFVKAVCGSLPCPPYVNNRQITCVVCTK